MSELAHVGRDDLSGRDLYVLQVPAPEFEGVGLPARFGCFLSLDASDHCDDAVRAFVRDLIQAGAAYFAVWGPDCERVYDLIDRECIDVEEGDPDVIMTTWHEGDLDKAIWASIYVAFAAGKYEEGCDSLVAVVVDNPQWASRIAARFSDPSRLRSDLETDDDDRLGPNKGVAAGPPRTARFGRE